MIVLITWMILNYVQLVPSNELGSHCNDLRVFSLFSPDSRRQWAKDTSPNWFKLLIEQDDII